ncbi:MAG: ferredoxin--NADP reductase [Pseudomonadota bacterium]
MNVQAPARPAAGAKLQPDTQTVTEVTHWTDRLFSFRLTRPQSLRFRSGEFVMIGLPGENGKPILRAYSIASPSWDETLEFYSIKVADGPLTSRLQKIAVGDQVILRPKPVGTLVIDALLPGRRLYLIATGTGIAPFASLLRDPEVYEKFDQVVVTHTCRAVADLEYGRRLIAALPSDPLIGALVGDKVKYLPTTTQQSSAHTGRITEWIASGRLFDHFGLAPLDPVTDRVMICGSTGLNTDVAALAAAAGLSEGSNAQPGEYVLEKAFVG